MTTLQEIGLRVSKTFDTLEEVTFTSGAMTDKPELNLLFDRSLKNNKDIEDVVLTFSDDFNVYFISPSHLRITEKEQIKWADTNEMMKEVSMEFSKEEQERFIIKPSLNEMSIEEINEFKNEFKNEISDRYYRELRSEHPNVALLEYLEKRM